MKVAVIGGGVAGVSAVWALNEHSNHDVHLFEANDYVGGHTNTVLFEKPNEKSKSVMTDTGFIVFNKVTYPNFLAFLNHLNIKIIASDMSFSVKRGEFEWAGATPVSLFCQWSNLFSPTHWRMVWDIIRFNHQSVESLAHFDKHAKNKSDVKASKFAKQSIGEWLKERGYSQSFVRNYLVPMTACIWSTPADRTVSEFPALTLLRFMHNHHLLQILDRPQWLTLNGGSRTYVERVLSKLPESHLHKGSKAGRVVEASFDKEKSQWLISTANGHVSSFDRVIFASHADTTARILSGQFASNDNKGKELQSILQQFEFNKNTVLLHTDEKLMPVRRSAWSAWNFITESQDGKKDEDGVVLTYWMNLLQSLDEKKYGPILVTLNAPENVCDPAKTLKRISYEHPVYTAKSVEAQKQLRDWQGIWNGAHFAGAWTNYGFHEDGFSSGLRAAYALGATPPFEIKDAERQTATYNSLGYLTNHHLMDIMPH
ncbi:FAD/NAD(P)-binding domain-containing protein [Meira miltonrushii]|uniref:FAD/NAD(P)-binding domain-containing protein n=1 Tax=Meira miltonrushii TaxID=1280837 RepID=A0A316VNU9_9BASI|nr:FAD/NAD(P)-binding domain-containing protein [Meira miltonrushii]PWN37801.1 FAD/NAD(P)-binding domain-containing protein [Meira miltonrushii]